VISSLFNSRSTLAAENLALRQQLASLQHLGRKPTITRFDRLFWVLLSKTWSRWKEMLCIVQPETVIRWHREGFKRYWTWKSRRRVGRPKVSAEIRELIIRVNKENPLWGAPRIHGELLKLGFDVSEATVSRYMPRHGKPPSQTRRTFLKNHMHCCAAIDFFTVPTVLFQILYVFIVLSHDRRRLVHFNVTAHPTATWTAQQIVEAFPWDTAPRYVIRDRDSIYGLKFCSRIKGMGMKDVKIAPRSPWQNCFAERVIGSIRRECLNHMIVISETHLRRILHDYSVYYNESRTHLSLNKETISGENSSKESVKS
jgi:transposase InsO family protein